jgi:hypothetical protein
LLRFTRYFSYFCFSYLNTTKLRAPEFNFNALFIYPGVAAALCGVYQYSARFVLAGRLCGHDHAGAAFIKPGLFNLLAFGKIGAGFSAAGGTVFSWKFLPAWLFL